MNPPNSTSEDPQTSTNSMVVLQIERKFVKCSRKDLITHSDYFKAMFEGNFVESSKNIIPLNGVEADAMVTILKLLWDREYVIEGEQVFSVLQAACMLQFLEIKEICIRRILEILSAKNCLKAWVLTEHLDLKNLYLKAKLVALLEFTTVKDSDYFLELSLQEVVNYLGSINLQCSDETSVFDAIIEWYSHSDDKSSETMLTLLRCLDFTKITTSQIQEYLVNFETETLLEVANVLRCILLIKSDLVVSGFEENCIQRAQSLLKSKNRNLRGFPCILVENVGGHDKPVVLHHDKFNRKRKYNVLENNPNTGLSVVCISKMPTLKKLFDLDPQKCANLEGFKMLGYKQFVYLFGGEYGYGTGDWNLTFYMFDSIKEKLEQKDLLPFPRRHFESCICGDYLFIVGGIGPFRVKQKNLFWYHLTEEKWSNKIILPCSGRQLKCCCFNNKLFILNINKRRGYSFDPETESWTEIFANRDALPSYSTELCVFSHKSNLFIKENKLFELQQLQENTLKVVKQSELPDFRRADQVESVMCNNILYSLKERLADSAHPIFLETFNVDSLEIASVFENTASDEALEVDNDLFIKFRQSLNIFSVFHHNLIDGNDLINDSV